MNSRVSVILLLLTSVAWTSEAQVLYRVSFDSTPYNLEGQYSTGPWSLSHLTTGGWSGSGAPHLVHASGASQYNMGWYFSGNRASGHTWVTGDTVYLRFRIRYDDDWRWDGAGSMQNKMIDFGMGGVSSRVILHQERPHPTTPCGLDPTLYDSRWGSLSLKVGITYTCTPPVAITYGRWHHVQLAVKSGSSATASFKLWVDNNNAASPSSQRSGFTLTAEEWNNSWTFGGFMSDPPIRTSGFVVDDFEVALTFDPQWNPGISGPDNGLPWRAAFDGGTFAEFNGGATPALTIQSSGCYSMLCARGPLTSGTLSDNYADHYFGDFYTIRKTKVEELYLVLASKFDSGYVWPSDSQKIAILNLTDGTTSVRRYQVYVYVDSAGRYVVDCANLGSWTFTALRQNTGPVATVRPGLWDRLKLYVKLNTPGASDGVVKLWVNDVLRVAYSNVNIRQTTSYGMNKLNLSSYATNVSGSSSYQWWDEWQLSNVDPDPIAPVGVRIVR
jgi:hypothetical protein